jgi:1-aminocyclopropane-1-carboxylate deaminase/D-cysteine desulfhydrase-like pyridoxal-dependent ACC family enzyme
VNQAEILLSDAQPRGRYALSRLLAVPRVSLGRWPTPLHLVPTPWGPVEVKRDDLSGFGRGGAKTRKIEQLLGLAQAVGARSLVAVAGNISNLAFDLVQACGQSGLELELLIVDDPPMSRAQRQQLFAPLLPQVRLLGSGSVPAIAAALWAWGRRRMAGERPLLLPPGASRSASVAGNALALLELAAQKRQLRQPMPAHVYVSLATGNTAAGLVLAAQALEAAGLAAPEIIGVPVYPGRAHARALAQALLSRHLLRLGRLPPARYRTLRGPGPRGFGSIDAPLLQLCQRLRDHGLEADPIFSGKAWAGMEADLAAGRTAAVRTLFWHCGFTPEWQSLVRRADG